MSLEKGTNSYLTVEEADTYFENRLYSSLWEEADDTTKEQALIVATSMLDDKSWIGTIADAEQLLAWPRQGTYFDPKLGYFTTLNIEVVPQKILDAVCELAIHLLSDEGLLSSSSSALNIQVGPIKIDQIQSVSVVPRRINILVRPLLANGANTWWRAN
jgi:hypothetical protein